MLVLFVNTDATGLKSTLTAHLQAAGHLLRLTGWTTVVPVSNTTDFPLSITFRMQPTNGEDTGTLF